MDLTGQPPKPRTYCSSRTLVPIAVPLIALSNAWVAFAPSLIANDGRLVLDQVPMGKRVGVPHPLSPRAFPASARGT